MSAQSLHAGFPARKGSINLPYEIFLLIVEAMISEAYERARHEKVLYTIDFRDGQYQSVSQSSFSVVLWGRKGFKIQMQRWKQIRDLLRIDGTSRRLVKGAFVINDMVRVAYFSRTYDPRSMDERVRLLPGCVLPDVDIFEIAPDGNSIFHASFTFHPQPDHEKLFQLVRRVKGTWFDYLPTQIWPQTLTPETLLCFPNLREIWNHAEQNFTGIDPRVSFHDSHDDDMPLDTQILPELGLDASGHDLKTLKTQLRVAEKRGIDVYVTTSTAWTQSSRAKTLRLSLKDGAVRMRFLDPHCGCYLELSEDLRALGFTLQQAVQQQD
ncbi:hypothetical protein CLIM01_06321 [Colletotrichum limetticola]|uniref:Uncharacterized protein n=1 Tax=Colletotrichum limetticola TaxID=1209924 RepID=A0ABQ9PXS4_9PEZI|nr:hypothetical protein CLIM01_06321 [Colletotrichum limetticola]